MDGEIIASRTTQQGLSSKDSSLQHRLSNYLLWVPWPKAKTFVLDLLAEPISVAFIPLSASTAPSAAILVTNDPHCDYKDPTQM